VRSSAGFLPRTSSSVVLPVEPPLTIATVAFASQPCGVLYKWAVVTLHHAQAYARLTETQREADGVTAALALETDMRKACDEASKAAVKALEKGRKDATSAEKQAAFLRGRVEQRVTQAHELIAKHKLQAR